MSLDSRGKLSVLGETLAGVLSGCLTRGILGPLDVLKIRMQLSSSVSHPGMFATLLWLKRTHGIFSLWRGSATGVTLWAVYMGVQFPVYHAARREAERWRTMSPVCVSLCSGAFAGIVSTVVSYPLDWARTRLTVASEYSRVGSLRTLFTSTLQQKGGLRMVYLGLFPSVLAIAPSSALHFAFYECLGSIWDSRASKVSGSALGQWVSDHGGALFADSGRALVCGGAGGGLAKLIVYPLDTVKKRMQVSSTTGTGLLSSFLAAVALGGPRALFRGLTPSLYKAVASSGLAFFIFETVSGTLLTLRPPYLTS